MKAKLVKLVVECPTGRKSTIRLPYAVAFAAARGIAKDTHSAATLYGPRGIARFDRCGGGSVDWFTTGDRTTFNETTTVCI